MYRIFLSSLFVAVLFTVVLSETPQDIVTKYKNYRIICSGLGYKDQSSINVDKGVVAFQAMLRYSISDLGDYQAVKFDIVKLNEGSSYDGKTGKFTAPENGVYSFSWSVLVKSGLRFPTDIVKNGKRVAKNYADGSIVKRGYFMTSSSTVNIKMKKNDQVWIRAHGNGGKYIYGDSWSNFSGFKL